ncbi:hypothetical protein MUP79_08400 [Candidatus Bathyarchaeota archaeon]|nr:hypothetical protein [Candidatus Bathyarchaeota archaeon]
MSSAIDRLVDAAIPEFYPALSVLFVSANTLQKLSILGEEKSIVIALFGEDDKAREPISLAKYKFSQKLKPFLSEAVRMARALLSEAHPQSLEEISAQLQRLPTIAPEAISPVAVSQVAALSDLITIEGLTAESLAYFMERYDHQPETLRNPDVIRQLSGPNLKLIEPRIQIAICSACHNFELIASTHPIRDQKCSVCNNQTLSIRLYAFDELYAKHKSQHKDLPLFIREYISRKAPRIRPTTFKETVVKGQSQGDIDVYVAESSTGFECKLFLNPTPEDSQIKTYVEEILGSIRKYIDSGVARVLVVTNLSEKDARRVYDMVVSKLKEEDILPNHIEVLPNSVEKLVNVLTREAQLATESLTSKQAE